MYYMGLDVGTQGVRCVVADAHGNVVAAKSVPFEHLNIAKVEAHREQSPRVWRDAAEGAIAFCTRKMREDGLSVDGIRSVSVDGTSGTIVPLDADFAPLMNGIMYNDPRAGAEAKMVHAAMPAHEAKLGYRFGASFSLPRILWIKDNLPDVYAKTRMFAHQADYVAGLLCGEFSVSDYSNALKTGYDLIDGAWPDEIASVLGIDTGKLPTVVRPGEKIAKVTKDAAERLGLSCETWVVGGSTDGYASALAAGAVAPGSWASIIGTTFVLKGVTEKLVIDPNGSSYSHKLPGGAWLLGGASNIGGRTLNGCANGRDFASLDREAEGMIPTGVRCYPLPGRGERFPFVKPDCEPFYVGDVTGGRLYPAVMEGVGFAERLAFEHMQSLGCAVGDEICTTGGACRSPLWMKLRASILGRTLKAPRVVDAAMGSALLAASDEGGLERAARDMIVYDACVDPDPMLAERYDAIYREFLMDIQKFYGVEG